MVSYIKGFRGRSVGSSGAPSASTPLFRSGEISLRAGLATSPALAGADPAAIMRQTRHKSVDVAWGYVRVADIWRDNVTARVL